MAAPLTYHGESATSDCSGLSRPLLTASLKAMVVSLTFVVTQLTNRSAASATVVPSVDSGKPAAHV